MKLSINLIWLLGFNLVYLTYSESGCSNFWNANLNDPTVKICPVSTDTGETCSFPFVFKDSSYNYCLQFYPDFIPKCLTTSNKLATCLLPTDAVILGVTTQKGGQFGGQRGASLNGGTLLWLNGLRFAPPSLSTSPDSSTSNTVVLTDSFNSYNCTIHPDATTTTQIACFTEPMKAGTYQVQVIVKGALIPLTQYPYGLQGSQIIVSQESTPKITNIQPITGLPGTFVSLTGNFITTCLSKDTNGCSADTDTIISRLYFGGQLCQLFNSSTNQLYQTNTATNIYCQLAKPEVGYYKASLLVSNQYGRSVTAPNIFYISPDENVYNFQTFAQIESIYPQVGSTAGGTLIKITGKYLYHSSTVPAVITIAGQPCNVVSFDMKDQLNTVIVCETTSSPTGLSTTKNYGNRGITVIFDKVKTSVNDLATVVPSSNANYSTISMAKYSTPVWSGVTVWFIGFLNPKKTSEYEFSLVTNGNAVLIITMDSSSNNETVVCTNQKTGTVVLNANKYYYYRVIGSNINGGTLSLSLNAKMFNTILTSDASSFVQNAKQNIKISSTVVYESYEISYSLPSNQDSSSTNSATSTENQQYTPSTITLCSGCSIQTITVGALNNPAPFVLSFYNITTDLIPFGASSSVVESYLNDIPLLSNQVSVSEQINEDQVTKMYTVQFSANMGQVPLLKEITGSVNSTIVILADATLTGYQSKLFINEIPTDLFNFNDSASNIKIAIDNSFGIRCPSSISVLNQNTTSVLLDYENCKLSQSLISQTAFCGKCASTSNVLFSNLNITMDYKYLCGAYKTPQFTTLYFNIIDPLFKTLSIVSASFINKTDNNWHYVCVDLYQAYKSVNTSSTYPQKSLKIFNAYFWPAINGMYMDVVSMKNTLPNGINLNTESSLLINSRRINPSLQYIDQTFTLNKTNTSIVFSFRPTNCTCNLNPITLTDSYQSTNSISRVTAASPPVSGTFNLNWNGQSLNNIPYNIPALDLANLFSSLQNFGFTNIVQIGGCDGFSWDINWINGGKQPLLTLSQSSLSGSNVSITLTEVTVGGAMFNPLLDDFLVTSNRSPQVSLQVNNINAKCNGSCDFTWSDIATPKVFSIDANNHDAIKLQGTGFDWENINNNLVKIGDIPCNLINVTSTIIFCSAGQNPIGTYDITLNVLGKGRAVLINQVSIQFSLQALSLNPQTGTTGGGNVLNITGTGFSSNCTVTVDGNNCLVTYSSYNILSCIVPSNPTTVNKNVDVIVNQLSFSSTVPVTYLYNDGITPKISSIQPNILSVLGGETVTISGNGFSTNSIVFFGKNPVLVLSSSSNNIVLQTPVLPPGLYDLNLIGSFGNALTTQKIEYRFYVTSFTPNIGSISGGTDIDIYGEGFSTNCSLNQVKFGVSQSCNIRNCSGNWIRCRTSDAHSTYYVTNSASNPMFGYGYAWTNSYLNISIGDTVKWSWKSPIGISNVAYQVLQVPSASSTTPEGFSSGSPSGAGSFSYQFNQPGTYYYWSGFVESTGFIQFRGVIQVSSSPNINLEIDVSLGEFSAQKCAFPFTYNDQTYNSCTNDGQSFSWCSPTSTYNSQILKCDPMNPVSTSQDCPGSTINLDSCGLTLPTSLYTMTFAACNSTLPQVKSVSAQTISFNDTLTVTGINFSSNLCENQVLIGDYICPLSSSSTKTSLVCQLAAGSGLVPSSIYKVNVLVKKIGFAILADTFKISFLPKVNSFTPTSGSTAGGTQLVIYGDGFIPNFTGVSIGQTVYLNSNNIQVTNNRITIQTMQQLNGNYDLSVYVNNKKAICAGANEVCQFSYSETITPFISSAYPLQINGTSNITIIGTLFGNDASQISVIVGAQTCIVNSASSTTITCQLDGLSLGNQLLNVNVNGIGNAKSSSNIYLTGLAVVNSITPNVGSIHGGTIVTVTGNGFSNQTKISFGQNPCVVLNALPNKLKCQTVVASMKSVYKRDISSGISIGTDSTSFNTANLLFNFNSSVTPNINTIYPTSGFDQELTISGSGFGSSTANTQISVGAAGSCKITSISDTRIVCNLNPNSAGTMPVIVNVNGQGNSNNNINYTFNLVITSLSNNQASIGGGLLLTINGNGFSANSQITICGNNCSLTNSSLTALNCIVPQSSNLISDSICNLIVTENGLTASNQFSYKLNLTPTITNVSPKRGGTGGGTLLTIFGTNFPTNPLLVNVTIVGIQCTIKTISSTQIQCQTGSYAFSSVKAPIQIAIIGNGNALNSANVQYQYIDLWSSQWTWGGNSPPGEGSLAYVGPGQIIYFDAASTPVIEALVIQGGSLIFDDNQDVSLNVKYILILDNGTLQIGTSDKPFMHNAVITMHGHARSIELPIFGTKVIGVRNGTVDMHGANVGVTWTHLGQTATAGATKITLKEPVIWPIGSQIVIATTGDHLSQGQTETAYIIQKSNDNTTLTLDHPLSYEHLSEDRTVGIGLNRVTLSIKAEVGLLSRNVVFKGYNDDSWNRFFSAPACPETFNPNEFAVQSCFLGRYGPELGSDQFGAIIEFNKPVGSTGEIVIGRFSNVELTHVGQSFRLGRYPIHFHMNGDMPSSYVKECSIHQSFNRAINVHACNYINVQRNVIYNILGGAVFLEDGVEIGNVFEYNLALFVKQSSTLTNEDLTPASYWATNPNNTFQHNTVAGGTHIGFWYRMFTHSTGPSFRPDYCPYMIPFGKFFNNTAHSTGIQGIWIFPKYLPSVSGSCDDQRVSVAQFVNSTLYLNNIGFEAVDSNQIQFINSTTYDNKHTGVDFKGIHGNRWNNGFYKTTFDNLVNSTMVYNAVIVGSSKGSKTGGATGIAIAWDRGQTINNVKFYNFIDGSATLGTEIEGDCVPTSCGAWTTKFQNVAYSNVTYKHVLRFKYEHILYDVDGSLTGTSNNVVVGATDITTNDPNCFNSNEFVNAVVCSNQANWVRFSFNGLIPHKKKVNITNINDYSASAVFEMMGQTHGNGFSFVLQTRQSYFFNFNDPSQKNLTWTGGFYATSPGDYIIVSHLINQAPDQVSITNWKTTNMSSSPITETNNHGDWFYENSTNILSFMVKNENKNTLPFDIIVKFNAYICFFPNCIPPSASEVDNAVQNTVKGPVKARPADALFWSNISTWQKINSVNNNNKSAISKRAASSALSAPTTNSSFTVPAGVYLVVDAPMPDFYTLTIQGILELDNSIDHRLAAQFIFIDGGQLIVGWENNPILTNVEIVLLGTLNSFQFTLPDGMTTLGGKGIGVYGGLDLHGSPRNVTWTRLASTVSPGMNNLTVIDPVDWKVGELILIGTTGYKLDQTETMKITAVSLDRKTLTLNASFINTHLAYSESFADGTSYKIAAAVGLLSRNIKVIGDYYDNQFKDLYGFRIIVSNYMSYINGVVNFQQGFARISNVEMANYGQYHDLDDTDLGLRYGILMNNLGNYNSSRASYVNSSVFHDGLGVAIGIINSNNFPISNNVIHRSLRYGIKAEGSGNIIRNNLIAMTYFHGTFRPLTNDPSDTNHNYGAIDVTLAKTAVIENNMIAGAQKIGIYLPGSPCVSNVNDSMKGNTIYGATAAVVLRPQHDKGLDCNLFTGFVIYKSTVWAIYSETAGEQIFTDNILVENGFGIYNHVHGPRALDHIATDKTVEINNMLIVGQSDWFNCNTDIKSDTVDELYAYTPTGGRVAMAWPSFNSFNNICQGSFFSIGQYSQIAGLTNVVNVTFAHFKTNKCGLTDIVISSNPENMDGSHPVHFTNIKIFDVANSSKAFIHRPDSSLINPTKCVDMDCDGLKKNLLNDIDGGFLGAPGAIIAQSEFGWGDQKRGLGDFRIPKELLSYSNGSLKDISKVYTYRGNVRDESLCTYQSSWQAYQCYSLDYKWLVIESMDNDTETRRLSPIAVLSDNGYLDLINGMMDHGWCAPYSCATRISTFFSIIAAQKSYDIYLTGTPPNQIRFRIINSDTSFKARLSLYYYSSQRIDLYRNGVFINSTNSVYNNGQMTTVDPSGNLTQYMPNFNSDPGTNLFYKQQMYFTVDGTGYYDLIIAPVLVIAFGFPAVTPESFFSPATVTNNMALLLGIPANKIVRVNIIRATSKKRAVGDISISLVVASDPAPSSSDTTTITSNSNTLKQLEAQVSNKFVTGQLQAQAQSLLNVTISGLAVQKTGANSTSTTLSKVSNVKVLQQAAGCSAQVPCSTQPVVAIVDANGAVAETLGNDLYPWIIQATLSSSANSQTRLLFSTTAKVINGIATFKNLGISTADSSFSISYSIQAPQGVDASSFNPLNVATPPIQATIPELACSQSNTNIVTNVNSYFSIRLTINDKNTGSIIPNIGWNNDIWNAQASLHQLGYYPGKGKLIISNSTSVFNPTSGFAAFNNLQISGTGMYLIKFTVSSTTRSYSFSCYSSEITILPAKKVIPTFPTGSKPNFIFKFEGNYNKIVPAEVKSNLYNYVSNYGVSISSISTYSGSVYITFLSTDTSGTLLNSLIASGLAIDPNLQFSYASINNNVINCTKCQIVVSSGTTAAASATVNALAVTTANQVVGIAVGTIVGALFGAIVAVIVTLLSIWGVKEYKKTKVRNTTVNPSRPESENDNSSILWKIMATTENSKSKKKSQIFDYKKLFPSQNKEKKAYIDGSETPDIILPKSQNF